MVTISYFVWVQWNFQTEIVLFFFSRLFISSSLKEIFIEVQLIHNVVLGSTVQ